MCHPRADGDPGSRTFQALQTWIPTFLGMTSMRIENSIFILTAEVAYGKIDTYEYSLTM